MSARRSKVIGYFAYASPTAVVCTGSACVISGSRRAMQQYLSELDPDRRERNTIKKTTFEEIKRGLELGGAYAFDETSYKRFYPLAKQAGLGVMEADFEQHKAVGERFLIIQLQ
jgi:hypothetical protein